MGQWKVDDRQAKPKKKVTNKEDLDDLDDLMGFGEQNNNDSSFKQG
eukprot:CAMPEP_0170551466 /NCGR_PEP_ID=MMETSP0211-20121228/9455_1 /TAXON_ID=311385 /ORGANISM="Pseudokeronopsis sp., Strain OXSARD2" /LENGTH=45 /DNA_ID= /DNA_START= /DNA_END= /DNA_ORIENTATION=